MEHTGATEGMGGEGRKEEECVDVVRDERALGWRKEPIASRGQAASRSQRAARDHYPAPLDGSGT